MKKIKKKRFYYSRYSEEELRKTAKSEKFRDLNRAQLRLKSSSFMNALKKIKSNIGISDDFTLFEELYPPQKSSKFKNSPSKKPKTKYGEIIILNYDSKQDRQTYIDYFNQIRNKLNSNLSESNYWNKKNGNENCTYKSHRDDLITLIDAQLLELEYCSSIDALSIEITVNCLKSRFKSAYVSEGISENDYSIFKTTLSGIEKLILEKVEELKN